jgi:hypothetical protein
MVADFVFVKQIDDPENAGKIDDFIGRLVKLKELSSPFKLVRLLN